MIAKTTLVCKGCHWIFHRIHSDKCPRCGGATLTMPVLYPSSLGQPIWRTRKLEEARARIDAAAKQTVCCYTSTSSGGWRHDTDCPQYVMCY